MLFTNAIIGYFSLLMELDSCINGFLHRLEIKHYLFE